MALKPIGYGSNMRRRTAVKRVPPPVGGLNGRDAKDAMAATDAFFMENWFPQQDGCVTRLGCASFATGMVSDVQTIFPYVGGATAQLLAFAGGSIWNVSAGGAVGAALKTGRVNDKVIGTMFSNAGSQFLIGVNGVDEPFSYDGAAYAGLVITGVTTSQNKLRYVCAYASRLFFAHATQLGFYYLAVGAIQGAASFFDLSQICRKGGVLTAIGTLSQDAGNGPNDYIFFLTSEGEAVIYSGTDPSSAAAWSRLGQYQLGKPVGNDPLHKYGADSLIITDLGVLPASVLFSKNELSPTVDAITSKLGSVIKDTHSGDLTTYGWQIRLHTAQNMLIVNAPHGSSVYQYVMNTATKAWTRFTGWNALCFAEYSGALYYGGKSGVVYKANTGYTDNGTAIDANVKQAYSDFDSEDVKLWHNARVIVEFVGTPPLSAGFNIDFDEDTPSYVGELGTPGTAWDTATWDVDEWESDTDVQQVWLDINQEGFTGSIWLRSQTSSTQLKWFSTHYLLEGGGPVGGKV